MSLLIDTSKLLPRDAGRPPKGVYKGKGQAGHYCGETYLLLWEGEEQRKQEKCFETALHQ